MKVNQQMAKFFTGCHKQKIYIFYLELPSLHVALAVSPGSDELLRSFSISFSSKSGIPIITKWVYFELEVDNNILITNKIRNILFDFLPSAFTTKEVSNEVSDPARALQDGVCPDEPVL